MGVHPLSMAGCVLGLWVVPEGAVDWGVLHVEWCVLKVVHTG